MGTCFYLAFHYIMIGIWCNGNTADSGPAFPGSNPGIPTKQKGCIFRMEPFFVISLFAKSKKLRTFAISYGGWLCPRNRRRKDEEETDMHTWQHRFDRYTGS